MAEITILECDVTKKRTLDVSRYEVVVNEISVGGIVVETAYSENLDLTPWALERLKKFIDRGTSPPDGNSGKKDEPETSRIGPKEKAHAGKVENDDK